METKEWAKKIKNLIRHEDISFVEQGLLLWETMGGVDSFDEFQQILLTIKNSKFFKEKEFLLQEEYLKKGFQGIKHSRLLIDWVRRWCSEYPEFEQERRKVFGISLSNRELYELPDWLRNFPNLKNINLGYNQLTELPDWLEEFHGLEELQLFDNQLEQLPGTIGNLPSLRILSLGKNRLTSLPPQIGELHRLEYLNISQNRLRGLPREFTELRSLQELYIMGNEFFCFPEELQGLYSLTRLYCGTGLVTESALNITLNSSNQTHGFNSNSSNELPDWIGDMVNLRELSLAGCGLTRLPKTMQNLKNLDVIDLTRNNFHRTEEPKQLFSRYTMVILKPSDKETFFNLLHYKKQISGFA